MSEVHRHLSEIADLWNRAERRTKEVEQFNGEVAIACINEMRYAGRRVVDVLVYLQSDALTPAAETELIVQLSVAKNYLVNADHDLTDAVIVEVHDYVLKVLNRHGRKKIARVVPEFERLYRDIVEANGIVTRSREDRALRNAEYDRLASEYLPKLMDLARKLKEARELRVGDDVRWSLRIITILGIVGSFASIVGVALAVWALWLIFNPP